MAGVDRMAPLATPLISGLGTPEVLIILALMFFVGFAVLLAVAVILWVVLRSNRTDRSRHPGDPQP